jgi:TolB-like protein/cytochrome c-type biogenesis protein CcmH/NrfG
MPERSTYTRRLVAIFSADVAGYTRLMAADEAATLEMLDACRGEMSRRVAEFGGRVVDAVGDNLLAEFPSAVAALQCAFATQRALAALNEERAPARPMRFRIGIHVGDVIADGDRIAGDGVNIAARIESRARPGGVALSGAAWDQVEGKLPLRASEQRPQQLKNVGKPVRVYDVEEQDAPAATADEDDSPLRTAGFTERHAIAVLPFANLSEDVEQEYFADGLAEDLITSLAALRIYPIIARNSSFTFKGRAVDVRRVGEELGAAYVVSGSVRRAGHRVRVNAELVEARAARQIWSGRFDSQLEDMFDLQDELTAKIAGAVGPAVSKIEMRRALNQPERSVDVWDCIHRGLWHLSRFEPEHSARAEFWARRAIELQPNATRAWSVLAFSNLHKALFQWSEEVREAVVAALSAAEKAASLDRDDPLALTALGFALSFAGRPGQAVDVLERAVRINPSSATAAWALGAALGPAGRPDEAIPMIERAIRLSPQDPLMHEFLFAIAASHFVAGRYEEAIAAARNSLDLRPGQAGCCRVIAASLGHLGRCDEARPFVAQLERLLPGLSF